MSKRMRLLSSALSVLGVVVALALAAAPAAHAQVRAECRSVPSKILGHPVRYCAFLPPSYDANATAKYPVLYFLHGLGGNEQLLLRAGGMNILQDLLDQKKIGEFIVIAPDAGKSFYINSHDGKVRYEDFFFREFMPAIESRYRIKPGRENRGVTGLSMGGFGALRYGFKYPQDFGSVSAHSAAIIEKLPEIELNDEQSDRLGQEFGGTFGDPIDRGFWQKQSVFTVDKEFAEARRPRHLFRLRHRRRFRLLQRREGTRRAAHREENPARIPPLSRRPRLGLFRASPARLARVSLARVRAS